MTYEEKIPEFALQPAKAADENPDTAQVDDGFDPTPYDRLLVPARQEENESPEQSAEAPQNSPAAQEKDEETLTEDKKPEEQKEMQERDAKQVSQKQSEELAAEGEEQPPEAQEEIQPVFLGEKTAKDTAAIPAGEPIKIMPLAGQAVYNDLKLTAVAQCLETKIFVEEDILVPDIKPDLISILSMDGKAFLSSKEIQVGQGDGDSIKVTGEVTLQTIYLPEDKEEESISIIQSRLPFKTDWQVTASPLSHLVIEPTIERIDYSVINERKFRAKITLGLSMKEYAEKELQFFESLRNEKLELLKETIKMSHIALRKEESVELSEDLKIKEGNPKPIKILKTDINVVENHKQTTSEKMVINAAVRVNVLYMGEEEKDGETIQRPAFFQGKADFTQFILMNKEDNLAMSKVSFSDKDLDVEINEEEEDGFILKGTVNTSVEVYQNLEKEVVSDLYHSTKDTTYDYTEKNIEAILGTSTTEVSAREIFDIPEKNGPVGKILYINGRIKEQNARAEQGRATVEGILEGTILCIPEDPEKHPFAVRQDIPFRGAMDIPAAKEGMKTECQIGIKDLWSDKINGKQAEVNASLQIETAVIKETSLKLIKNPCFIENDQSKRPSSMVLYITRKDDSLWKIAKKYKTSIETIKSINELNESPNLSEGTRLLIVK
ncbi:DUF3794 domain-containing protein [Anaerovorax odorimutans]|uniref:DUF3794 domain-containing protein n=1 Tax=Anaerovorax odorimutans TaxID=109327 RepID=A0ABT1RQH3_9FIRM|nr:SPOCS domain-containing protein [Anaerovorax odorimutans]MCQ4637447.1 DUF3794 domain-containing protein [Anaerovorax odorimutans]